MYFVYNRNYKINLIFIVKFNNVITFYLFNNVKHIQFKEF